MPIKTIELNTSAKRLVLIAAAAVVVIAAVLVAKISIGGTIAAGAPDTQVADLGTALAPDDPRARYSAGVLYERTLEARDAAVALREFEAAAALAPNDYGVWLAVGRIREARGDRDGAVAALTRARSLAPNYARVRWALGNVLLRRGDIDAAFGEMRAAAAADSAYARPIVVAARQFYDGGIDRIREAAGDSPAVTATLSAALADDGRFDEALQLWQTLSRAQMSDLADTAAAVLNKMVEARQYSPALKLANLLDDTAGYAVGSVYDGGFEKGIATRNAKPFEWRIGDGSQPQAALTDGQRRSGAYSLLLIFRPAEGASMRPLSQAIAVRPGTAYKFQAFYRSDLKTPARIQWRITSADGRPLASTEAVSPASDWTALTGEFTAPDGADGVIITLAAECSGTCSMAGNLWLDDISLTAR